MAQFKRSRVIMFGAFALSGALAISGMNLLALLFGWVAVRQLTLSAKSEMVNSSIQAAKRAFESLNVVMFDKRWVGARATVAKVLHQQLPTVELNGRSVVRVIAVAQGGTWFSLDMAVSRAQNVELLNLQPLSEPEAKFMLASDLEAYETFFGKPDNA
ncbi:MULTISPECIES: hypothetical protein [Aeromonas]|uniref:Uncharacterized protein n=1 Tax=Aeromonas salmonicida TaxID=645 RepID=A0AAX1PBV8_AERSA|nr:MULTISPECIES: hypothetical protein [Aeromonas]MDU4190111.1 hypothetical protein [Aeromonas sp.]RAI97612.1 hypothetical protein DEU50_13712 [Aeromonas salmonicida]